MQLNACLAYKDTSGFTPHETVITLTKETNMSNKKQKKNNFYSHDLQLTIDSLAYTSDDDLRNLHDSLRKERDMTVREGFDSTAVETSICYVQREISVREVRRSAHMNYIKTTGFTVSAQQQTDQNAAQDRGMLH